MLIFEGISIVMLCTLKTHKVFYWVFKSLILSEIVMRVGNPDVSLALGKIKHTVLQGNNFGHI